MSNGSYSRKLKIQAAKEALLPENKDLEHVIAKKYGVKTSTIIKWKDHFLEVGEEQAFKRKYLTISGVSKREQELQKEILELREEVEILKKAAAFLVNVKRD